MDLLKGIDFMELIFKIYVPVLLILLTYFFAKRREYIAVLRKEKFDLYKQFVSDLTDLITWPKMSLFFLLLDRRKEKTLTNEDELEFQTLTEEFKNLQFISLKAANKLNLFASQEVLDAFGKFHEATSAQGGSTTAMSHIEEIYRAIRQDCNKVSFNTIRPRMWKVGR